MDDFDLQIRWKYRNSFKMIEWIDTMAEKPFFLAGWYIDESWSADIDSLTACYGDLFAVLRSLRNYECMHGSTWVAFLDVVVCEILSGG